MSKEGRLIILATGANITDVVKTDENPFNASCTIVPDAYLYADCRSSQSARNKVFAHKVAEALHEGKDIVLIAPRADMIDKRLRAGAITFSLPEKFQL